MLFPSIEFLFITFSFVCLPLCIGFPQTAYEMSSEHQDWLHWHVLSEQMHVAGTKLWQDKQEDVTNAIKDAKIFIFIVDCFINILSGSSTYSETFSNVTWKMCHDL